MRTALLDRMVEATEGLPAELQDDVARMVLTYLGEDRSPVDLTADDEAAIALSRRQSALGQFVSDDEMRSVWARYDT